MAWPRLLAHGSLLVGYGLMVWGVAHVSLEAGAIFGGALLFVGGGLSLRAGGLS